jgi:hypothetical protein
MTKWSLERLCFCDLLKLYLMGFQVALFKFYP